MISLLIFVCCLIFVAANAIHGDILAKLLTTPITVTDQTYSCPPPSDPRTVLNNFHIRGTALGGWLVLEPWLTPSLFYQFLGASKKWGDEAHKHIGLDSITFCTALGKSEANRQLRNHWKTWVTEDQIKKLADSGVNHLRVPVADWMFLPYEPFVGCWDGALEELDRVLELCQKYQIKVLIDLHALRRSQVRC
jgi:glucan 1,3-beta-glucosidase